jgi:hypothetical protein
VRKGRASQVPALFLLRQSWLENKDPNIHKDTFEVNQNLLVQEAY